MGHDARPARRAGRPLQRPDAARSTATPPYLDLYEWLLWTGVIAVRADPRRGDLQFYFIVLLVTWSRASATSSGSGSCASRRCSPRTSTGWPGSGTSRRTKFAHPEATIRPKARRRGADAGSRSTAAARCRPGAHGRGTDADRGPPLRGRPSAARRAARDDRRQRPGDPQRRPRRDRGARVPPRTARIEPHTNPNTAWFIVIEGGGWVVVEERDARVAAGEAVLWPPDVPHGGVDRSRPHAGVRRGVRRRGRHDVPGDLRGPGRPQVGAGDGTGRRAARHAHRPGHPPPPDPDAGEPL